MISIDISSQIAVVRLTRTSKMNALNMAMFLALKRTIKSLRHNRHIRAIILTAEGDDFCTGLDVQSVVKKPSNIFKLLFKWLPWQANLAQYVSVGWRKIPVPVIVAINGRCWGGGLQIALGGDYRIAASNASFAIMEAKWGLIPDMGGNLVLAEIMAKDQALRLAMTGEVITAEYALSVGLISQITEQPFVEAQRLALKICESSPDSVAANKCLYHKHWQHSGWRWLAAETCYQIAVLFGKNQRIASYRQQKQTAKPYLKRSRWWS